MLFTQKECSLLLKCLDDYSKSDVPLHTELNKAIVKSCISKLQNLNALTTFTGKELSAICASIGFIEDCFAAGATDDLVNFSSTPPSGFYRLLQKADKLRSSYH